MSYLLDTNTFITAKNTFYAYDIVPTFWRKLLDRFQVGTVKVIDAVATEVLSGNDELTDWFRKNIQKAEDFYNQSYVINAKYDEKVVAKYQAIANKIYNNPQYDESNKQKFLTVADPWIVAAACVYDDTVVTFETMAGANSRKIKIPDVCQQMDVHCVNLYEMMRNTEIKI
ncbi:DUF4411 family protein [Selenomonas sp. AB3002]|uniref:DUF4411 family protein n=1 Tax=Selenomonas sp. AB3002 TaxID=1392502 RepID=UPI0004968FC2